MRLLEIDFIKPCTFQDGPKQWTPQLMFGKPPWTLHGIFRWKNSMHQGGSSSTTSPTILEKHRDPGDPTTMWVNVDVSENSGFSLQIIHGLIGFSIINHPFWDTTIFGNTHVELHQKSLDKKTNMHIPAMMIKMIENVTKKWITKKKTWQEVDSLLPELLILLCLLILCWEKRRIESLFACSRCQSCPYLPWDWYFIPPFI